MEFDRFQLVGRDAKMLLRKAKVYISCETACSKHSTVCSF